MCRASYIVQQFVLQQQMCCLQGQLWFSCKTPLPSRQRYSIMRHAMHISNLACARLSIYVHPSQAKDNTLGKLVTDRCALPTLPAGAHCCRSSTPS